MDEFDYLRFLGGFCVVLGLIALCAVAARRLDLGKLMQPRTGQGGQIGIVESRMLDARRRLVLVRRGTVGHLMILGPNSETVVETGIDLSDQVREGADTPPPPSITGGRIIDTVWPGRRPA